MKLVGDKIFIRFLEEVDAEAMCDLYIQNKDFFQKYSPTRHDDFYTYEWQCESIKNSTRQRENDERYLFGVFLRDTETLIGNVTLSEVLRGPLQSCFIGYSLDQRHNGKGYMAEAVRLALDFAYNHLLLHRIEAGAMPHNLASIRVLEKAGFQKEGIARKNVKINGVWEDHQVLAIVSDRD